MLMTAYHLFPFEYSVETSGKIVNGDNEKLSEIIAKFPSCCIKIGVYMPDDLFSATLEEMEALVKKACAIATKKRWEKAKGYYYFGYEYKDGRLIIKVCERVVIMGIIDLSLSFVPGRGNIEHNLRIKNGNPRTWGIRDRKSWNTVLVKQNVRDVLRETFEPAIRVYNERQIADKRYNRTKTIDDWIDTQLKKRTRPYTEYIIQLGNKLTGCTYEHEVGADGFQIDESTGTKIMPWQTKKNPKPVLVNGKVVEGRRCKWLKRIYKKLLKRFQKENPGMKVVCAAIHADEKGGVHMHVDAVPVGKTKNGIGLTTAPTSYYRDRLDELGVSYGKTRKDNAQKVWQRMVREALTDEAKQYGINIIDAKCKGRKRESTPKYIEQEKIRIDYLDWAYDELEKEKAQLDRERAAFEKQKTKQKNELENKSAYLNKCERDLNERECAVRERERKLKSAGDKLNEREAMLRKREAGIEADKEAARQMMNTANRRYELAEKIMNEADKKEAAAAAKDAEMQRLKDQVRDMQWVVERVKAEHPEWLAEIKYGRGYQRGNGRDRET